MAICIEGPQRIRQINPYKFFGVFAGEMGMALFPIYEIIQSIPKGDKNHRGIVFPLPTGDVLSPYNVFHAK